MYVDTAAIAKADSDRTERQFLSFLSGVVGGNSEQSVAGEDGISQNLPGQYQAVSPFGVAVEGRPVSNLQSATVTMPIVLILLAGAAFFLLHK